MSLFYFEPATTSINRKGVYIVYKCLKILINLYMKRVHIYINRLSSPLIKPVNDLKKHIALSSPYNLYVFDFLTVAVHASSV